MADMGRDIPALLNLLNFLCWYERDDPNAMWGGVKVTEALNSLQTLLQVPDDQWADLKNIALLNFDKLNLTKGLLP